MMTAHVKSRHVPLLAVHAFATPATAASHIAREIPIDGVDLIKIDVDNSDCQFAQKLLYSRAKVIHLEILAIVPPPIAYIQHLDTQSSGRYIGCSLGAAVDLLPGYRLLQLEFYDAVFIREDLAHAFQQAGRDVEVIWRLGYFCHPLASRDPMPRAWADPTIPVRTRLQWVKDALGEEGLVYLPNLTETKSNQQPVLNKPKHVLKNMLCFGKSEPDKTHDIEKTIS